jgi:hypothetical protein
MRAIFKLSFRAGAVLVALPAVVGCGGIDGLYGDDPPAGSPPVILDALEACNTTARTCIENAEGPAAARACTAELQACRETALQPVVETVEAIQECNDGARQCLAATADAGRGNAANSAREACFMAQIECIDAALPPPPPCLQSLEDCLNDDGEPRECLETAVQCLNTALRGDGGR